MTKGGVVQYSGPLNGFLESERLPNGIFLTGVVEYADSAGSKRHEGKFKLEMFGGIVLYDDKKKSLGSVLPSQVTKATGERWAYPKGNSVTWYPKIKTVVFVL